MRARVDLPAVGVGKPRRRERSPAIAREADDPVAAASWEDLPPGYRDDAAGARGDVDAAAHTRLSVVELQCPFDTRAALGDPRQVRPRGAGTVPTIDP